MTPAAKAQFQIHACVLLWGFTAILGKLITLPALPLVWWRMLLVVAALALVPRVWRGMRTMSLRLILAYCGIGALVALHWLTFYGSIKLSNASVGATCIALATPMTALLEPWLARRPFSMRDVLLGVAVLPGVVLVVGGVPVDMRLGIAVGAVSALLVALRHMSAFSAQLAVNLEPVYAIVLAIVLLNEQRELTPVFYIGVAIILLAVLVYPLIGRPKRLQHPEVLATSEAKGAAE